MNDTEKSGVSGEGNHTPLFTGDPHRDTAVSTYEIAAELADLILEAIRKSRAGEKMK